MANDPTPGAKPFPSAKTGASDDDIFAEMGRMLAQDTLGTGPAKSAPPGAGNDLPLELTHVVKPGKPQAAKPAPASPAPASPAPAVAAAKPAAPAPAAAPKGTKVSDAIAMLDGQPKASGVSVSNRSLDSLVQDLARPMVQEWIERNLERITREEVAKAVAKAAPKT